MRNFEAIKNKIHSLTSIKELSDIWKDKGEKLVFTNGCFDLLHLGHITYLSEAADLGTKLIVGINSDISVRGLDKGASRPIKDEETRLNIMASLQFVDAVVMFEEQTPFNLIQSILPHVLVKGGDYNASETDLLSKKYIIGSDVVAINGGKTEVISFLPGHSTTKLENKIIESLK